MKPRHSQLVVSPSRSVLLVGILLCVILALALVVLLLEPTKAQNKLVAAEAKGHVGETATVC